MKRCCAKLRLVCSLEFEVESLKVEGLGVGRKVQGAGCRV